MSHPSRTKTQGGDRFSRNRPFSAQGRNLWAGWSDSPAQKLLARSWTGPEIFIKILSFHQKLFNFLIRTDRHTDRHTDRQTDTRTPIHIRAGVIFLCLFLIPFTSLRSLRSLRSWRVCIFQQKMHIYLILIENIAFNYLLINYFSLGHQVSPLKPLLD